VWKALPPRFQPQLVIIEYNAIFSDADVAKVVPYDADFRWDGSAWVGASLGALVRLARQKGYTLVHCSESNAFFVADEYVDGPLPSPQEIYARKWGYIPTLPRDVRARPWVDCGSTFVPGRKLRYHWMKLIGHRLASARKRQAVIALTPSQDPEVQKK
jgi:hypothetical protein